MIDSGATGSFIDRKFVSIHSIPTLLKEDPYKLNVIDGREVISGMVTHNTTPIVLQVLTITSRGSCVYLYQQ